MFSPQYFVLVMLLIKICMKTKPLDIPERRTHFAVTSYEIAVTEMKFWF